MTAGRGSATGRVIIAAVIALLLVGAASACGSSDSSATSTTSADTGGPATTADPAEPTASTTSAGSSTATAAAPSTTVAPGLPDASEAQRTAPGDGTGTALLKAVRVGRNPGFERIVFEFVGSSMPGYRVQWVDGPITADGSGEPVKVDGAAHLEIVMQPASGVDLSAPQLTITYAGPDRVAVAGQTKLITDLVRTGDFENVLSWVAGTTEKVPFRVLTLTNPTRIAVDLVAP